MAGRVFDMQQERPVPRSTASPILQLAGFVGLCLLVAAFNLRPALTSLATVLSEIQGTLRINSFWAGILTTIPVLCFGVFGPLAPLLSARFGIEKAIFAMFVLLTAALGLRIIDSRLALLVSTLAGGAAIGVVGVLLPVIIRRDFSHRLGLMTGLYTMVLSVGGAVAAGFTPILERSVGSWNVALAAWCLPAVAAAILWGMFAARGDTAHKAGRLPRFSMLFGDKTAWYVTGFMGLQAALAFIVLGWLPTLLRDRGIDVINAGMITSLSIVAQTVTALLTPVLATRRLSAGKLVLAVLAAALAGFMGLLYGPVATTPFWGLVLGLGQGGMFGLALLFISLRSPTSEAAAMLSGMAQSIGYLGAALGPLAVSLLRDVGASTLGTAWLFAAITIAGLWCGLQAARPGSVRTREA
ncbi:MFS transporter [Microvirga brassicacearum]|uniref:MFS transporter n=1 Tax=Microvirga brassicacearum TaxID=2580413 RepID=A0A5N3PDA0_9HYPH|nr:MFS transporter [Microvirga brassicacearum]KAB0267681.1 MFS transporter [Microvirga brassicacearum]